jgi:chromosomal replication initiation ATPase DnaA
MKARFFERKTHYEVPDSLSLAPEARQIMQVVCSHYRIGRSELVKCRRGHFNEPRAVAIHLIRTMRKDGFAAIGSQSGLKSYSAVGGVLDSIRKRLASDQELSERCQRVQRSLTTGQTET